MTTGRVGGDTGAIHDIGYRGYDGPRLGSAYVFQSLLAHSLRGTYGLGRSARSKVMPMLLLAVMTMPAVIIAGIAVVTGADELPVPYPSYAINLQVVIAVFVASQAPQLVSRDLRHRVIGLYFSRPLTHAAYVRAKLLAMAGGVLVLTALPLLVLYVGALLAQMSLRDNTIGFLRGLAGAVVLSAVLAAVSLVIAAYTTRRGLGVAAVVTVLLVLSGVNGAVAGISQDQGREDIAGWAGLISPFSLVDGVQVWAFGADTSTVQGPPGTLGGLVFVLACLVIVALSYLLLLARYRRVSV